MLRRICIVLLSQRRCRTLSTDVNFAGKACCIRCATQGPCGRSGFLVFSCLRCATRLVLCVMLCSAGWMMGLTCCTRCLLVACICLGCVCHLLYGHVLGAHYVNLTICCLELLSVTYAFQTMAAELREALASSYNHWCLRYCLVLLSLRSLETQLTMLCL